MTRPLAMLLLVLCACEGSAASRPRQSSAQARGQVVARVQGSAIGLEQVRELARATGLSPREALTRLEDALLLEQRAVAEGYQQSAGVAREAQRALVRALLAETVEAENTPESIPVAQVRERFESERERLGLSAANYPQYAQDLRAHMLVERRRQAFDKLVARLRTGARVVLDEAEVQRLLSDSKIWGAGT
jgi:hypothetical protein